MLMLIDLFVKLFFYSIMDNNRSLKAPSKELLHRGIGTHTWEQRV